MLCWIHVPSMLNMKIACSNVEMWKQYGCYFSVAQRRCVHKHILGSCFLHLKNHFLYLFYLPDWPTYNVKLHSGSANLKGKKIHIDAGNNFPSA